MLQEDRKRQADMKKAQLAKEAQLEEGEYEAAVRSDEFTTLALPRRDISLVPKTVNTKTVSVVSGLVRSCWLWQFVLIRRVNAAKEGGGGGAASRLPCNTCSVRFLIDTTRLSDCTC